MVSIGLPTFNRPKGLERTIEYLIEQQYQNIEIIISDNCSSNPEVKLLLEKYSGIDERIKYFIQETNIEIEPNFNFVYQKSIGKYFMWISDDDVFCDNYISECVAFLEDHPDYFLCSGVSRYIKNNTFSFEERKITYDESISFVRLIKYYTRVFKNGVFYGVYRNTIKFESPIQKHIGGDWNHVARVALLGKINILDTIKITRSDDGGSSSRRKIVSRWGSTGIQKIFFETYTAYQISKYLFNDPLFNSLYSPFIKKIIQTIIFILLNVKFIINFFTRRIARFFLTPQSHAHQ